MIKLSDMLIATLDDKDPLIALQINEAKRLEALDVPIVKERVVLNDAPPVECEMKPLFDNNGDGIYLVLDNNGKCVYWTSDPLTVGSKAKDFANTSGQPHSTAVVMAPDSGKCGTVVTVIFFPERPHEWVIYRPASNNIEWCWCMRCDTNKRGYWWYRDPMSRDSARFATADEAQAYIDENDIADAYPWAVPKLNS